VGLKRPITVSRRKLADGKEASFKSARMMSRLAESSEGLEFSAMSEAARPSFLRRRREEGKAEDSES
jgi:hypothetical protein